MNDPKPQSYNILIIDDHPIIIEGYENALKDRVQQSNLTIHTALNCEQAIKLIIHNQGDYQMILLDISLPPFENMKMNSGEDLGLWIRNKYPEIKLFVLTSFTDPMRINSICDRLIPEGFLIKSEITTTDLVTAFLRIQDNKIVLGQTVSQLLLKKSRNGFHLDDISVSILREISNGTKTVDLPKYIPLSKSGIEKRKRLLKSHFNNKTDTDRELIIKARKNGYL